MSANYLNVICSGT